MSATRAIPFVLVLLLPACAVLHHAQIGDVDAREDVGHVTPIDIKVSETGASTLEATEVMKVFARNAAQNAAIGDAQIILELAQMGPRTGLPVWDATYAENVVDLLRKECPDGRITDLELIREANRYPVVSGEIVRITGDCRHPSERSRPS